MGLVTSKWLNWRCWRYHADAALFYGALFVRSDVAFLTTIAGRFRTCSRHWLFLERWHCLGERRELFYELLWSHALTSALGDSGRHGYYGAARVWWTKAV